MRDNLLGILMVILVFLGFMGGAYIIAAILSTPNYEEVYKVCDRAYLSNAGRLEEECAKLLDKTNTEYICNTYCWLEVK